MHKVFKKENGFSSVEVVLVIIIIALIGVVGWIDYKNHNKSFTKPASNISVTKPTTSKKTTSVNSSTNPYAGWESYTLPVEKLSFMYPSGWTISTAGSGSSWDNVTVTAKDGSVFNFEDGISNGGDGIPEAPATNDIPITFIGSADYLGLTYGRGDRGSGSSDGLISGVMLQTSTNINNGPNGGFAYSIDKYAQGSTVNYGTGVEVNFMTAFLDLGTQIPLQQVPGSTDIKTAELIIESMHY